MKNFKLTLEQKKEIRKISLFFEQLEREYGAEGKDMDTLVEYFKLDGLTDSYDKPGELPVALQRRKIFKKGNVYHTL
jgi:hypothetical protein